MIDGLKELGALGMKVPEQYGGVGLSQVYYNRALVLAGTWHSALATLLSAHQSIGVAEPLMGFGSEEQKQKWLPLVAKDHISAFLLTEPDVGSDPARLATKAEPTEGGYVLNGRKLWATNGAVADIVVVMAQVPKSEGHKGGITAFVLDYSADGVSVEHRNQFMGLRGIENSVTLLEDVFVPEENVIGKEGMGLKIALTTLNTGRLALPAICLGVSKLSTKIAREWSKERVQWGQPVGKHDAVAQKIAFIAATSFGLEAMLDVSSRLADDKKHDIRIEAALAKLYGSELGWKVTDELMQVRGGRGYETAESLKARGEKPVPVEQMMRDMRINRIFEGSTEIMHLLIAREAVDQHLEVAGELLEGDGDLKAKGKSAIEAGKFYSRWLPQLAIGEGQKPGGFSDFGELAGHVRYTERAVAQARALDVLRDEPLAGQAREEAGGAGPDRRHRRGALRDLRGGRLRPDAQAGAPRARRRGGRDGRPVHPPGAAARRRPVRRAVLERRRRQLRGRPAGPRGAPHVAGGGHRRPVGRRADDRRAAAGGVQGALIGNPNPQGSAGRQGGIAYVRDQAVRARGSAVGGAGLDWLAIERSPEFQELVHERRRFLVPATIVFLVGAIGYLLLAAFVPGVMGWQIADGLPFAWISAICMVLLTWVLTFAYLRKADRDFEPLEERAAAVAERTTEGAAR